MRGIGRRIVTSTSPKCVNQGVVSNYSTSGGNGRGRGRGSGNDSDFPKPDFVSQTPVPNPYGTIGRGRGQPINNENETPPGMGRGRGKPISSSSTSTNLPSFSSWVSGINPSIGRGQPPQESQSGQSKKPIFFQREEGLGENKDAPQFSRDNVGPIGMFSGLTSGGGGAGRGKVFKHESEEKKGEEEAVVNRHVRKSTTRPPPWKEGVSAKYQGVGLNKEEATKKAMDILAAGANKAKEGGSVGRGGFGTRGRGGRGRGRGNFSGRGGGRFGQRGEDRQDEDEDEDEFPIGDNADGERLAQKLGPELTADLTEVIDEYLEDILPDPEEDEFDEALDYNMRIECEPEYMVEFDNPDIDEKPPMPLRDVLEKVKPFMMAYEGIKDQAEWEEVVEEVMSTVPQMKQIVDHYCGPDRVTAKQQQQELERVAKTLPDNVPSSVKRFTDRAVLSLQSNPGWGWDKKCQFMDKLVWEVSQQYK